MNLTSDYFLKIFGEQYPLSHALWRIFEAQALLKWPLKFPLLDLGCGDGFFLKTLLKEAQGVQGAIYGLDASDKVCEAARGIHIYKEVKCADARNMPFDDNFFECVFSNSVIEHIPEPQRVIKEVSRILKPGGIFLFSAPTDTLGHYFFWKKLGAKWYVDKVNRTFSHHNLFNLQKWESILSQNNLALKDFCYTLSPFTEQIWDLFLPWSFAQREVKRVFNMNKIPFAALNTWLLNFFVKKFQRYEQDCKAGGNCVILVGKI